MKIFLISNDDFGFDCYSDFVIAANSEDSARYIAKQNAGDEGEKVWDTAKIEEVGIYNGDSQVPILILASYHAG